ncbi:MULTISPECIES: hypothetical protein [unclassified Halomonas]|uniref:hypothetical protein n=1 Tax=unclassified Halomonas TaxID=2609666 RepID=UPI0005FCD145|nr:MULTISPECIES: hypothetical protein [unclassified Halomonas]CEP34471.1 Putative uncharacterized protein [Halomonas sp. R57-5]
MASHSLSPLTGNRSIRESVSAAPYVGKDDYPTDMDISLDTLFEEYSLACFI